MGSLKKKRGGWTKKMGKKIFEVGRGKRKKKHKKKRRGEFQGWFTLKRGERRQVPKRNGTGKTQKIQVEKKT